MNNYPLSSLLAFSVAIASVTACEKKPAAPGVEQTQPQAAALKPLRLIVREEFPEIKLPECHAVQCPKVSLSHLVSSNDWVNGFLDNQIFRVYKHEENGRVVIPRNFQEVADSVVAFAGADADDEAQPYFSESVGISFMGVYNRLALFSKSSASYSQGAAHGIESINYYVLDLDREKQLTLDDILVKGQQPKLDALLHQAYRDWVREKLPDFEMKEYEQDWPYKLTENYTFGEHGLTFLYQEYEMAAYAYGMPELTVTYDKLKGIIKDKYLLK